MEPVFIKDLRQGMKNLSLTFIVLEVGNPISLKENREVRTLKVADSSACINLSLWDEPGHILVPGDIVRITKGYANLWRNCLTLYSGKGGDLDKIGDFCMVFNEQLNMSEANLIQEPSPGSLAVNNGTMNNGAKIQRPSPNTPPPSSSSAPGKNVQRFPAEPQQNKGGNKINNKPGRGGIRNIVRTERR